MLSWSIFKNYLLSRRSGALVRIIAWHCILGIGIGTAALVIVLSVMSGFNQTIRKKMLSVDPHIVVEEKAWPSDQRRDEIAQAVLATSRSGLESVSRFEQQDAIVRVGDRFSGAVVRGYSASDLHEMMTRIWSSSRSSTPPPERASSDLGPNEIIMGTDLARSLNVFDGDEVLLVPPETLLLPKGEIPRFRKYKVKGLFSTQTPEFDSKMIFYVRQTEGAKGISRDSGVEVRLNNPHEAEAIKTRLAKSGFNIQTWGDRDSSLFFALKVESTLMTLFLTLAVLITSFSIVIVMMLLLNQKRQDIGMLMALGLTLKRTRLVFWQVGLFLSYLGVFGGLAVGVAISLLLQWYPLELLPEIYTDTVLPVNITWQIVGFVLLCTSGLALVGSLLPIWRYSLSSPSEALRKIGGARV